MAVRLPDALRAPVTDAASGRAWVEALVAAGLEFHLEDSASTIGNTVDGEWQDLFTAADALVVDRARAKLYDLPREAWGGCDCPIGYMMRRLELQLGATVGEAPT